MFEKFFGLSHLQKLMTDEREQHLSGALVGKTIKSIMQIPTDNGWFIIFLKMTDNTSVHIVYPNLDGGGMRVQIDKADGTKLHLPEISKKP